MKSSKYTKFLSVVIIATAGVMNTGISYAGDMVTLLLPENVNPRWESQDAAFFVKHMQEMAPNIEVQVLTPIMIQQLNNVKQSKLYQKEQKFLW